VALPNRAPSQNLLLAALPAADRRRLFDHHRPVELVVEDILAEPGERVRHVFFPVDSFISLISPIDDHAQLEVGLVGNEGMLGVSLVLGVNISPLRALVQGGGFAWRLDAAVFRALALDDSRSRALEPISHHARVSRLHARSTARRSDPGGKRAARPRPDPL
jgi:hypothetical protein